MKRIPDQGPESRDCPIQIPSGDTITVPVREHNTQFVALLEQAGEAGFYTARVSIQAPGMPVAVNVDPRESDITSLTPADLQANLTGLDITVATSPDELAAVIATTRTGRSSWRSFMIAALLLLLAESLLADRMGHKKRTAHAGGAHV